MAPSSAIDSSLLPPDPWASGRVAVDFKEDDESAAQELAGEDKHDKMLDDIKTLCAEQEHPSPGDEKERDKILQETQTQWVNIIANALKNMPAFQQIIVDDFLTSDTYDLTTLVVDDDWLLGVYLPGFYEVYSTYTEGSIYLHSLVQRAVPLAKEDIESIIKEDALLYFKRGEKADSAPPPVGMTEDCVIALFKLAGSEKSIDIDRANLKNTLEEIPRLLASIVGGQELFTRYSNMPSSDADPAPIIDRFGEEVMGLLRQVPYFALLPLGDPPEPKKDTLNLNSTTDVDVDEPAQADAEGLEVVLEATEVDIDPMNEGEADIVFTDVAETEAVQTIVAEHASQDGTLPVFYPPWVNTYKKPKQGEIHFMVNGKKQKPRTKAAMIAKGPQKGKKHIDKDPKEPEEYLSAAQIDAEASLRTIEPRNLRRAPSGAKAAYETLKYKQGFQDARDYSQQQHKTILEKSWNDTQVLEQVVAYMTQQLKGDLNRDQYEQSGHALGQINTRPRKAREAAAGYAGLMLFGGLVLHDNFYHVRTLAHGIGVLFPEQKNRFILMVRHLTQVFAMIHRGVSDPLPWVLAVDAVMRRHWAKAKTKKTSYLLVKMMDELALFAHGVVLCLLAQRLKTAAVGDRNSKKGEQVHNYIKWYRELYAYNPKCALYDCLCLLPPPPDQTPASIRQLFSVGIHDARIGRRAIRSFISNNRDCAYPCLITMMGGFLPDKVMVVVIFWYAHLYHSLICKKARPKKALTAF